MASASSPPAVRGPDAEGCSTLPSGPATYPSTDIVTAEAMRQNLSAMSVTIRRLRSGEESVLHRVAPDVFDDPIVPESATRFLADPRHHLVVAVDGDVVVGFASAVHYLHPDKPRPELWINEVGVAPIHQGRGIAKGLLGALLDVARDLGCSEAWVLTDRGNAPAMRLYASAGGTENTPDSVMFTFHLDE